MRATIERDGQMQSLKDINGTVLANACGPCIGQWRRAKEVAAVPNTIVTSYNRNFPARNDGQATTMNFIGSPEIVTALALAGRLSFNPLTDTLTGADGKPFKLNPPKVAPEVPAEELRPRPGRPTSRRPRTAAAIKLCRRSQQRAPAADAAVACVGRAGFHRHAGAAEDQGQDDDRPHLARRPVAALPRPPRQVQRQPVHGRDQRLHGRGGQGEERRDRADRRDGVRRSRATTSPRGVKWVIVGDANYGEGSSREHAALCPRLLGGAAVIVRSFARIHESNLKKQGLLALTFQNPADYDRIREDDRMSLVGLKDMAPGKPVECLVKHADGTQETLKLKHTFSGPQLEWFRKGSALNLFHGEGKAVPAAAKAKPSLKAKAAAKAETGHEEEGRGDEETRQIGQGQQEGDGEEEAGEEIGREKIARKASRKRPASAGLFRLQNRADQSAVYQHRRAGDIARAS